MTDRDDTINRPFDPDDIEGFAAEADAHRRPPEELSNDSVLRFGYGTWAERVVGKVDVEVVPPGPGAWRSRGDDDGPVNVGYEWDSADAQLLIGDIADRERQSIAELTISAYPHDNAAKPVEVSVELMPAEIDDLIAALMAIKVASQRFGQ